MNIVINHRLGKENVENFSGFTLNMKYDSVASTFGFEFYFDPKNKQHSEMACVSHYHEAIVEHNGQKLLTGYILSNEFSLEPKKQLVKFGGYSKAGVLEDCEIPLDIPLETNGLSLREIVEKLIKPFTFGFVISGDVPEQLELSDKVDKKIEKTNAKESQNIKSYLSTLLSERNIVLSHNAEGDLVITKPSPNKKPLFTISEENGSLPGTKIGMRFNGQGMHSQITVVGQASEGNATENTVYNPFVQNVFRPRVVVQSSGDDITAEHFAKNKLAAELKNIVLTVETDRWEYGGRVVIPGDIISVISPELYLYKKSDWFVQDVNLKGDSKKLTAVWTCVPRNVYDGSEVVNFFVDHGENWGRG